MGRYGQIMSRISEVVIYNSVKSHPANVGANRLLVKTFMQTTYKIVLFFLDPKVLWFR